MGRFTTLYCGFFPMIVTHSALAAQRFIELQSLSSIADMPHALATGLLSWSVNNKVGRESAWTPISRRRF